MVKLQIIRKCWLNLKLESVINLNDAMKKKTYGTPLTMIYYSVLLITP